MASISDLPMPNHIMFLAYALTPVPELEGQGECSICREPLTMPVKTPCNHIFCTECLTNWLLDNGDSCPEDRTVFFQDENKTSPASPTTSSLTANTIMTVSDDGALDDCDFTDIPWPDDIDPLRDYGALAGLHEDDVLWCLANFDDFIEDSSDGLIETIRIGPDRKISVDKRRVFVATTVAINRLASRPGSSQAIHSMCRADWAVIMSHCMSHIWRCPSVLYIPDLQQNLREHFHWVLPALQQRRVENGIIPNAEALRFDADVHILLQYIIETTLDLALDRGTV